MSHYLWRRLGQGVLVLWAAFTLTFFLLQVLPGDAILIKFQNPDLGLSPQQIAEMRVAYGADSPLWRQYLHTLQAMLQGDFGYSLQAGLPVSSLIASNLPDTLALALPAFALAVLLAFAIAIASRYQQFATVVAGAVYFTADLLARHRLNPDLFIPITLGPGYQSRTSARPGATRYRGGDTDFRAAGANSITHHGSHRRTTLRCRCSRQGNERNVGVMAACHRQCSVADIKHCRPAAGRTDRRGLNYRNRFWPQRSRPTDAAGGE